MGSRPDDPSVSRFPSSGEDGETVPRDSGELDRRPGSRSETLAATRGPARAERSSVVASDSAPAPEVLARSVTCPDSCEQVRSSGVEHEYATGDRAYQTAGADTGAHSRADAERSDRSGAGSLISAQRERWTIRQTFEAPTFWGENVSPRFPAHVSPDFAGPSAPVAPASAKFGETCERDRREVGA